MQLLLLYSKSLPSFCSPAVENGISAKPTLRHLHQRRRRVVRGSQPAGPLQLPPAGVERGARGLGKRGLGYGGRPAAGRSGLGLGRGRWLEGAQCGEEGVSMDLLSGQGLLVFFIVLFLCVWGAICIKWARTQKSLCLAYMNCQRAEGLLGVIPVNSFRI